MSDLQVLSSQVLLVDGRYHDYVLERSVIESAGGALIESGRHPVSEQEVLDLPGLADASVLLVELAPITAAVLEAAKSCVAVVRYGTGLDNVDLDAARLAGVAVESVPGYAAASVSEHALLLLLATARRLRANTDRVSRGEWRPADLELRPMGLEGRVLGVFGMGAIGRALAQRASAFGMKVLATDPNVAQSAAGGVVEMVSDLQLLSESDYISLHLPLTPETQGMVNADWLSTCKKGMTLINTARGGLIDESALLDAIDSGHIGFAALDVSIEEPLPLDHRFRQHPRVLFTPHIAFWSDQAEHELRNSVAAMAASHVREVVLR
ncbi:MAG: NAD(P)-dependent oxidoreductase [Microcella sp.]|uniref:NAD(P)-dependent oxidoreductase n=1 Tax=Microcella sp. TaxID=1913979 RepID=UPI0033153600